MLRPPTRAELAGERLYGDDFSSEEAAEWFADEENAYARLGASDRASYQYGYHALNARHGFRHLPVSRFDHVLGVGSAHGDEFLPIENRLGRVTIVEPARSLRQARLRVPVTYAYPGADGVLPIESASVDLVLCLSVLHHIPNVSFAIREIARVLTGGGLAIIREPTISMGDWRRPRPGLTAHERGIPLRLLRAAMRDAGLEVVSETRCVFSLTGRLARLPGVEPYNSSLVVFLDELACRLFDWNETYHPRHLYQRLRPTAAAFVAVRP